MTEYRICERLRGLRPIGESAGNSDYEPINPDGPEAAALLEELAAALETIARDDYEPVGESFTEAAAQIARAALAKLSGSGEEKC